MGELRCDLAVSLLSCSPLADSKSELMLKIETFFVALSGLFNCLFPASEVSEKKVIIGNEGDNQKSRHDSS